MITPSLLSSQSGLTIALSISESPDLAAKGLVPQQLDLAMQELARYLLAHGAALAYGGDLRPGGFTEQLFNLVAAYRREEEKEVSRIHNYLAWPISQELKPGVREGLVHLATFHEVPFPEAEGHPDARSLHDKVLGPYVRSISFTAMRQRMHRDCQARIILGGKLVGYSGRCPGLLEEAWLALQQGVPLYVLGGFGGCAERVARALEGAEPEEFSEAYQVEHDPRPGQPLRELLATYRIQAQLGDPRAQVLDYPTVLQELHAIGPGGLNNGLSPSENQRLFRTPYLAEMVQLVLKGLRERLASSAEK